MSIFYSPKQYILISDDDSCHANIKWGNSVRSHPLMMNFRQSVAAERGKSICSSYELSLQTIVVNSKHICTWVRLSRLYVHTQTHTYKTTIKKRSWIWGVIRGLGWDGIGKARNGSNINIVLMSEILKNFKLKNSSTYFYIILCAQNSKPWKW